MFVVISKFAVNGTEDAMASVKQAFVERPHLVDSASGFLKLDVLSPLKEPNQIWLLTYWTDQTSFDSWYQSHLYQESHSKFPAGLRLLPGETEIMKFQHISS